MRATLVRTAATLSSGTIATLTGITRYTLIEQIQTDFVRFCMHLAPQTRWQDAWGAYEKSDDTVLAREIFVSA